MNTKAASKKKEAGRSSASQFLRSTDDEIKDELEAMTNLEYNLHSDYDANDFTPDAPLFSVKKTRNSNFKESTKHDKQSATMTEKSTTKAEKHETESQIQTYVPNASFEELQTLIHQAAATSEDKYKILDARDRLMRTKHVKSQHLSMTKVTRGTCPDMCPEKERLMRESQRQVAAYELLEGTDYRINHETAVKQYSRSSADQEEPLPQDLRPVKSLRMTMSYLLHEIADLCEQSGTNLAEWYHFLWDRTRGIRKDITQQELCCHESVELVEQCARFHIVCAERLCAEEVSVFDKKINTENLTKCLQTLKYMYDDLRIKDTLCKNEPEFRAYIILLNLNNGNFMWDVQRLPTFVQKSAEVRFAIEVYSCIESNNYAKFFRLVRGTTYLNACILLRYFNQVRVRALSVMVKAYFRSTAYPLYELIDILGFEDENEAVCVCERVGLNLSKDELHIMLSRQNFSIPMTNIEQGRACNYVEFKRVSMNVSVGQCIAGEHMPDKLYKDHKPHDSFDSQGYLKPESVNAEDQNAEKISIKQNDPYEYMDEDMPDSLEVFRVPEEPKIAAGSVGTSKTGDNAKTDIPHVFKMPIISSQFNIFQGTSVFPKQNAAPSANKKTEDPSSFNSNTVFESPKHSMDITSGFSQENTGPTPLDFPRSTVPLKRTREEDNAGFEAATPSTSIFAVPPQQPNVFVKPAVENAKPIAKGFNLETNSSSTTSIFDKVPPGNIFGNTMPSPSIFGLSTHASKRDSKSTTIASLTNSSIFDKPKDSMKSPNAAKTTQQSIASERQEVERKRDVKRRRSLELVKEKALRKMEREAEEIFAKLESEIIQDVCATIVKEQIDRISHYDKLSENIINEILNEYIHENCEHILNHEMEIQLKLEELSRRTKNRIVFKYYRIWRQLTRKKRLQRSALDMTPVWIQNRTVEECAQALYRSEQNIAIENMRRKRFKVDSEEPRLEYLQPIESMIYQGIKENARILGIDLPPRTFWKIIISWPHLETRPILWRYKKIMNQYICPSDHTRFPIVKSYKPNSYETLHICIKNFEGPIREYHLTGNDGLFFIATPSENPEYIVKRLTSTIMSRQKLMPVPIVVVILGETNLSSRQIKLNDELDGLLESGYVSEYTIHYEDSVNEKTILNLIQNATIWLTVNKSPPVPLEMDFLRNVVETCLTEDLWFRVLGHSSYNERLQTALKDVKFIIDLHNEAVAHLIDIVLDPESLMYTDFPPEFNTFLPKDITLPCNHEFFDASWKKEEKRKEIEKLMNELFLPKWTLNWPIEDTMELHQSVMCYCQQFLTDSNYSIDSCRILNNVLFVPGRPEKTNFVQILLEILREKIRLLDPQATVVYNKNHIRHFKNLPWWFKSSTLTNYIECVSRPSDTSHHVADEIIPVEETFEDLDEKENYMDVIMENYDSIREQEDHVFSCHQETKERVAELHKISEGFEKTLAEQKLRCQMIEDKLQLALKETDDISIF